MKTDITLQQHWAKKALNYTSGQKVHSLHMWHLLTQSLYQFVGILLQKYRLFFSLSEAMEGLIDPSMHSFIVMIFSLGEELRNSFSGLDKRNFAVLIFMDHVFVSWGCGGGAGLEDPQQGFCMKLLIQIILTYGKIL